MLCSKVARRLLIGLTVFLLSTPAFADTRFFIPDFRLGPASDTQLLINNKGDRDESMAIWVFQKDGKLLGQVQAYLRGHSTKALTLTELFGRKSTDTSGWLAAFARSDSMEMSYTLLGDNPVTLEAESAPSREVVVNLPESNSGVLRISDVGGYKNEIIVRKKDRSGALLGIRQVVVDPYSQLEIPLSELKDAASLELLGYGDFFAVVGERLSSSPAVDETAKSPGQMLSLVIDSSVAIGAYQVALRFDPAVLQFSASDISGGAADGFTSKPLSISIDNDSGELRIASFQLGSSPSGVVEVARINARRVSGGELWFRINPEEITNVVGDSALSAMPIVRLYLAP